MFTFYLLDGFMRGVAPSWSQKGPIAAYYENRRSPEERLIAYQLYWRGETFYTSNEIYEGPTEERTVFDQEGADEKLKDWMSRHRGRRTFFLYERYQQARLQGLLPPEARASFRVVDDQNNKFSLAQADLVMAAAARLSPQEVAARRQRFVEAGGALPTAAADRALLEAILASGEFLPELLFADVGALRAAGRRSLAAAREAARGDRARGARGDGGRGRSRRSCSSGCAACAATRCCGWARASWGGGRPTRSRASCPRSPTPAWTRRSRSATRELRRELGEPRADDGEPGPLRGHGDGQAGGEELNFSSDVDVCYFYSTDAGAAGRARRCTTTTRSCRGACRAALEQPTGDGMVFRVDLRLRPEGRNGPLCNSLAAAEGYYETFGRTWERQAWLRARPGGGRSRAGRRAAGGAGAVHLSAQHRRRAWSTTCAALRALFRDPADAGGALGETGFDVKLGAGGIRDVEMVVQALQLLHAGKRPDLRERNTPRAFPRLVVAGLLGDREAWTLLSAYRFWRRLEHRVQVGDGRAAPPAARRRRRARALRRGAGVRQPGGVRRGGAGQARGGRGDRRDAGRAAAGDGRWRRRACSIRCATAPSWSGWRRRPASATPRRPPTRWRRSGRACRPRCWSRRSRRRIPTGRCCTFAT